MASLQKIFEQAKAGQLPNEWLYLPSQGGWNLTTEGYFFDSDSELRNDEDELVVAVERGLVCTLDRDMIEDVVTVADRLSGSENPEVRMEAFLYYWRFDAFLPKIGAPDPPPVEEAQRQMDLQFYDSLGPESGAQRCKKEGCERGAIKYSVFCRVHHFEQIRRRACPFTH